MRMRHRYPTHFFVQVTLRTLVWFLESQPLTVQWSKFIYYPLIAVLHLACTHLSTWCFTWLGCYLLNASSFTQTSPSEVVRRGCSGLSLRLRAWLRLRLRSPKSVASASHFSCLEDTGFGFGFPIIILDILEATGFGFGFLNLKAEATGFDFGLGFLSPPWHRLRRRSH